MEPGSEKSDNEKSVSKNLFSKISVRKTLKNENLTTKVPAVNISKKKSTAKSLTARNKMEKSLTINNQTTGTLLKNS